MLIARLSALIGRKVTGRRTTDFNIYMDAGNEKANVDQLLMGGSIRDFETSIRHRSGAIRSAVTAQELITFNGEASILSSLPRCDRT